MNSSSTPPIKVLISEAEIISRIEALGQQISRDFAGKDLVVIGVLKGSFLFMADLVREIRVPLTCEFISVSSYGAEKRSSGEVKLNLDIAEPLEGRNLLLVEDIIDSGLTLRFLLGLLGARRPASIKVAALLDKPHARKTESKADYVGFTVGDEFVVGYGLDFAQKYRELPYIGVITD
jgi:hypoxanthine phosphoribosyltransferase